MKLSFEVEKVIILRVRGNAETINMELSEDTSKRIFKDVYDLNGAATLKLFVPRGAGERVCEDLGIPHSLISLIDDSKIQVPKFSKNGDQNGQKDPVLRKEENGIEG